MSTVCYKLGAQIVIMQCFELDCRDNIDDPNLVGRQHTDSRLPDFLIRAPNRSPLSDSQIRVKGSKAGIRLG